MTGRAHVTLAAAGVLVAAISACGVDTQREPVVVDAADVPFGLVEPDPEPAPTTAAVGSTVAVYLVDGDALSAVTRTVADDSPPGVLAQLLEPPLPEEAERGLRSALATDGDEPLVRSVDVVRGVAIIDLSPAFGQLDSSSQTLAIAQLVYTFTARAGTGQVALTVEGAPVEVPRADGTLTGDPLTRSDFPDAIAR